MSENESKITFPSAVNAWIFQANPKDYLLQKALEDDEIGDIIHWRVRQHKNEIAKGDIGIVWLSGKDAGI